MTLFLPADLDTVEGIPRGALGMDAAQRLEAVEYALAASFSPACVARVEQFLHAAHERARRREAPSDWIRDGLALCAVRRAELAAEGGEAQPAPPAPVEFGDW
jgi:hypothetical protein